MGYFTLAMSVLLLGGVILANITRAEEEIPEYLRDEYALMPPKSGGEGEVMIDWDGNQQLEPLSVSWEQLSWKILCDDDEWRAQFATIRDNLTSCLELTKILLPEDQDDEEEKRKRNWALMFSDGKSNPYCRLSRNWKTCYKMLEKTNCLFPNPKPLEEKKKESGLRSQVRKELPVYKDAEDWVSMHRPYKTHCLLSKAAYGINPFGLFG